MEITKNTRVSDILKEYGDIADVMELFGVQSRWTVLPACLGGKYNNSEVGCKNSRCTPGAIFRHSASSHPFKG